jgi:hydroxyacylglutathione hydrolase
MGEGTLAMILKTLVVGQLKTNCYLVACEHTREALIIDPGDDADEIMAALASLGAGSQLAPFQARHIVLTHFHFDHILAAEALRLKTGASLAIHRDDADALSDPPALFRYFSPGALRGLKADRLLEDGEMLHVGELVVQVLHTPGHSPGGIALWIATEGIVFGGDTLFREGVGRTDFPGCSAEELLRSIRERLFALPDETVVYPGHGPATTIGHERRHNPWVRALRR